MRRLAPEVSLEVDQFLSYNFDTFREPNKFLVRRKELCPGLRGLQTWNEKS
jgi:hypothetical protein